MPSDTSLTRRPGYAKRETAYAGWYKRWEQWSWRRNRNAETHALVKVILYEQSYEKVECEGRLSSSMMQLRAEWSFRRLWHWSFGAARPTQGRSGLSTTLSVAQWILTSKIASVSIGKRNVIYSLDGITLVARWVAWRWGIFCAAGSLCQGILVGSWLPFSF